MSLFPCKECIEKTGVGCCGTYPIMTYEEAAKIIYKYNDIINDLSINKISNNGVVLYEKDKVTQNNEIHIENVICPFLDKKEKRCLIYEDRPKICREYGNSIAGCPYKGQEHINEIKPLPKFEITDVLSIKNDFINEYFINYKPLKELSLKKSIKLIEQKEFQHMVMVGNYIGHLAIEDDFFKGEFKYGFTISSQNIISPYRRLELKLEFPYSMLGRLYNSVQRKILILNNSAIKPFENKLNKALQGLKDPDVDTSPEELLLLAIFYLKLFQSNFKNKNKQFTGLINSNELYEIEKKLIASFGFDSLIKATQDEKINEIFKMAERMYKIVQNLK